ncbi:MAG: 30S ribosomal protein S12 methylthiotransferase RimO [Spirochaetes bacterium]|nr:30S ribosomal protein S12 methylthiotransferase RimO [Spirochaetota bacterium]
MFSSQDISFYIISLGCAKNQVDSERINGALASAGYAPAESSEDADVIIINTCGFITDAKEESIEVIFDAIGQQRAAGKKNIKPFYGDNTMEKRDFGRRVAVVGCLSERYREEILSDIPEIDFLYGLPDGYFVDALSRALSVKIQPPRSLREPLVRGLSYAYLKISDGCSNNCAYCAIPLIRGPHRSWSPEMILDDARREAARGVKELVVVAQDISAYRWEDTGLRDLAAMLDRIDGIEWLRLMYCHPDHLDDGIISIFKDVGKVVPYIDIPFQHVSAPILRSMGRTGDADSYRALIGRLRDAVPDIRIRSTFMVGYPGETEKNFDELTRFIEEAILDRVGAFTYSPEEGTRAWELNDPVPAEIKNERYHRLMAIQQEISARKLAAMDGAIVPVLVEERIDEATWAGRSIYDAPEVDGIFYLTARDAAVNSIVKVRVTGSTEYDLIGEII